MKTYFTSILINLVMTLNHLKKLPLLGVGGFLLFSCEPPIETVFGCPNKRIRNIETGTNYFRLNYDDEGRLIERKLALNTIETNEFNFGGAILKEGTKTTTAVTDDSIIPDGELVISSSTTGESIGGTAGQPVNRAYTYNAAGNLLTLIERQGTLTITSNYTWLKGNLTKIVTTRSAGTPLTKTSTLTYFTDVINSTSSEFQGIKIFGKQSYNAPKSISVAATGLATTLTNYVYLINECGCITNSTVTAGATTTNFEYTYEKIEN
jgi:YD repeat-containing protein